MHSYTGLAVLALAASSAAPALSAPIRYSSPTSCEVNNRTFPDGITSFSDNQKQAREPISVAPLLKNLGISTAIGALPEIASDLLNHTR